MIAGDDDWRAELRSGYARTLPDKFAHLELRLSALVAAPADEAALDELFGAVHRLHGSAGSYGFAELGHLAGEWELQLLALRDSGGRVAPDALESMWARLAAIRRVEGPAPPAGSSGSATDQSPPRDESRRPA